MEKQWICGALGSFYLSFLVGILSAVLSMNNIIYNLLRPHHLSLRFRYAPFDDDPKAGMTLFEKVKRGKYTFDNRYWKDISEEAKDLIRNLLVVDPAKRITAEQALAHPWIAKYQHEENATATKTTTPANESSPTLEGPDPLTSFPKSTKDTHDTTPATPNTEVPAKATPISARRKRNRVVTENPKEPTTDNAKAESDEDVKPTKQAPKTKSRKVKR